MLTAPRAFLLLMLPSSEQTGGMRKKMEGDSDRTGDSKRRDIPYLMTSCSGIKAGGKEEEGWGCCLPK